MQWPEEATEVLAAGRELTELRAIGKWTARIIEEWLTDPPELPELPEQRSGFITLADARRIVADHPDWRDNLKADLQMHTTWSDGHESVIDMAGHAAAQGHEYVALTDHSKGLPIANGMDETRLLQPGRGIAQANEQLASEGTELHLLRAIEMNLSPEGEGDMSGTFWPASTWCWARSIRSYA